MTQSISHTDVIKELGSAVISPCGKYRYRLWRAIQHETEPTQTGPVLWVMLNPSTADATRNDNTIRRCITFTRNWGYPELLVGNVYALRSSNPAALWKADDPDGPENLAHLHSMASKASLIIAAWGRHARKSDADRIAGMLSGYGDVWCMGVNEASLTPRHPLFLNGETPRLLYAPKLYRPEAAA